MPHIIYTTVKALALVLLVVQLAVTGILFLGTLTSHQVMIVTGGSMEPTYHLGSAVLLDVSDRHPSVGDVVTFYSSNDVVVTHRVLALHDRNGGTYLQTKGDANPEVDHDLVSTKDVLGKPGMSVPSLGYVITFLTSPVGKLMTFGPALALIAGREIRRAIVSARSGENQRKAGMHEAAV